jgi:hypothetical protein
MFRRQAAETLVASGGVVALLSPATAAATKAAATTSAAQQMMGASSAGGGGAVGGFANPFPADRGGSGGGFKGGKGGGKPMGPVGQVDGVGVGAMRTAAKAVPVTNQADLTLYSEENQLKRSEVKRSPAFTAEVSTLWDVVAPEGSLGRGAYVTTTHENKTLLCVQGSTLCSA